MMQRLLELRDPVAVVLRNHPDPEVRVRELSAEEWELLGGLVRILGPVFDATTIISGDAYPTLSLVLVLYKGMISHIRSILPSVGSEIIRSIGETLIRELTGYTNQPDTRETSREVFYAVTALCLHCGASSA